MCLQWGFIKDVPTTWTVYYLPIMPTHLWSLVASGLNSQILVSRADTKLNFCSKGATSNVEWIAIGY